MWRLLAFILPVIRLYFIGVKVLIDQLLHKAFTLPVLPRQNGRVAIVTGGARGMGYETSRHLASLGTHVVIAGNEEEEGLIAVKKIQKESGHRKVEFMYLDLSSLKSVRQFVQRFKARGLPLHTLVNNGTRPFLLITAEGQTHLYRPIEGLMMRKGHCLTPESLISGAEAIWLGILTNYPALAVHNGTLHKVVSSELKHQGRKVWVKVNMACSDLDTLSLCHNRVKKTVNTFSERAGVMLVPERKTEDGFELHFGLNYLGHFLLTNLLLDVLRDSGQSGRCSRIITVSSATHYGGRLDLNDLQGRSCYCSHGAYSQSKLALVLFTYHLQEQLWARGDPVTANAVDPGMVDTDLYQNLCSPAQLAKKPVAKLLFRTPAEGASTAVYAAAATELEGLGGLYLYNGQKKISSASSYEKQLQEKLWTKSCAMVGLQKA